MSAATKIYVKAIRNADNGVTTFKVYRLHNIMTYKIGQVLSNKMVEQLIREPRYDVVIT